MKKAAPPPALVAKTWSDKTPGLQLAWDATSLSETSCWRKYQYSTVRGYRKAKKPGNPSSSRAHIEWGGWFQSVIEVFEKARIKGKTVEQAMFEGLRYLVKATWDEKANKPWESDIPQKTRATLILAFVWYCDEQSDVGGVQPYAFADGSAATEVSFRIPIPLKSKAGEQFLLCGHIDSWCTLGDRREKNVELFVRERKTTAKTIGAYYFTSYAPNVQLDTYDLAVWLLYPELKFTGVMLEAIQVGVNFARVVRKDFRWTQARREEWLHEVMDKITQAEFNALHNDWPMDRTVCNLHGGCPFRNVCKADPSQRERILTQTDDYIHQPWDPLIPR